MGRYFWHGTSAHVPTQHTAPVGARRGSTGADAIGVAMSAGARWLTALVTGSAVIGAGAALASASPSSPSTTAPVTVASAPIDPATVQTRSVVDQARQLAAEIATIQGELSQLERQVPIAPTAPVTVPSTTTTARSQLTPTTTTAPVTHTTTGASSTASSDDGGGD